MRQDLWSGGEPKGSQVVTKLDVAKRHAATAVRMFFERKDPLSIHTVTCAMAQVVSDLLVAKNGVGFLRSGDMILPEKRKEALQALRYPENFLKHADRDRAETLRFNVELVPHTLFEALYEYQMLTGRYEPAMSVFVTWYAIRFPSVILDGPFKESTKRVAESLSSDDYDLWRRMLDQGAPGLPSQ